MESRRQQRSLRVSNDDQYESIANSVASRLSNDSMSNNDSIELFNAVRLSNVSISDGDAVESFDSGGLSKFSMSNCESINKRGSPKPAPSSSSSSTSSWVFFCSQSLSTSKRLFVVGFWMQSLITFSVCWQLSLLPRRRRASTRTFASITNRGKDLSWWLVPASYRIGHP